MTQQIRQSRLHFSKALVNLVLVVLSLHVCFTNAITAAIEQQQPLSFHLHTQQFMSTLLDCILDQQCHILYMHYGKTSGTTIEALFVTIFDDPSINRSCCGDKVYKRFLDHQQEICLQNRAYSIQAARKTNHNVIQTCFKLMKTRAIAVQNSINNSSNTADAKTFSKNHRALVLTTFREPVARLVSYANQLCNKDLSHRDSHTIEACKRCNLDQDENFWNRLVNKANGSFKTHYHFIKDVAHVFRHNHDTQQQQQQAALSSISNYNNSTTTTTTSAIYIPMQLAVLDSVDTSSMIAMLKQQLSNYRNNKNNNAANKKLAKLYYNRLDKMNNSYNAETHDICEFKATGSMYRAMKTGSEAYRNMTLGIYSW